MGQKRRADGAASRRRPGDSGYTPSRPEAAAFNRAFRDAMAPRVVDRRLRDRHMMLAHWDVERAVESLRQEESQHLGINHAANQTNNPHSIYPYNSAGPVQLSNRYTSPYNCPSRSAYSAGEMPYNKRANNQAAAPFRGYNPGSFGSGMYPSTHQPAPFNPNLPSSMPNFAGLGSSQRPRTTSASGASNFNGNPFSSVQNQETLAEVNKKYPPARTADIIRRLPRNPDNIEQERRDAVIALRDNILEIHGIQARLSISQAILLMHVAEWDMGTALANFTSLDNALDRLHVLFDRMRSSEGDKPSKEVRINGRQERQGERLALLLSITTRPDWRSLQALLARKRFNLVETLLHWFQYGIEVDDQTKTTTMKIARASSKSSQKKASDHKDTRKDAFCNPIPAPSPTAVVAPPIDGFWAPELDFYRRVLGYSGSQDLIPVPELREDDRFRAFGFLIHPDRTPLQTGSYHVEDYFVVEYISKNDYWYSRFAKPEVIAKRGSYFKWPKFGAGYGKDNTPDSDGDDDKSVAFDFSNKIHVDLLNNWRRQIFCRVTGVKLRGGSQQWQPVELAKLYELVDEHWTQYVYNNPGPANHEAYTLPVSRQQLENWADILNTFFVGTRPGNTAQIRGERTWESVGTQLRRTPTITEEFRIPEDKGWFSKKKREYRDEQRREIAFGKDLLANWDPRAERQKTKQQALPAPKPSNGTQAKMTKKQPLPVEDDTMSNANDSDATKERKAHSKRSRAKLMKENEACRKEREQRRVEREENGEEAPDEEDVLGGWRAVADDDDEGEEGDDGRAPAQKKRKTGDGGDEEYGLFYIYSSTPG